MSKTIRRGNTTKSDSTKKIQLRKTQLKRNVHKAELMAMKRR